ncbi:hypothetical protein [Bacillus pumilus]|uniref:hypothetical protein n=1 Tax=Bacillus pumilus TaxID=1408 RepID=UPI00227FC7EF|nr:hypothetical protein [Bacillus pumilus]MCY7500199.1 hypothetical protein [Bacillus pumilus]MCY7528477.1 hypothetical protein [Bacillus pumilus]MED4439565.1 hypothetical protein [Bacillus pumilus]MED4490008.1 hypothetical protein [Bacillus pumilus]
MRTFEKIVSIDGYKFRIKIKAKETFRTGRWSIDWTDVVDVETNKRIYRGNKLDHSNPSLKHAFELAAKDAKKALEKSKETNKEIEEFNSWDGVINC